MAERRASVVGVGDEVVTLRADGACSDCGGCGGRCTLFPSDTAGLLALPRSRFRCPPREGDALLLTVPEGWLARAAARGYGLPLAGLLAGGAAGHGASVLLQWPTDAGALAGAALGTLAAFTLSKGAEPQIAVQPFAAPPAFPPRDDSQDSR